MYVYAPSKEGIRSPGTGIISSYEWPKMKVFYILQYHLAKINSLHATHYVDRLA